MEILTEVEGGRATIAVSGWLDTQTAPELAAALDGLPADATELALDFSGLEYISSAGLRQVVAAHKKMEGALVVKNVSPEVMDVFCMTGFDKHINFA